LVIFVISIIFNLILSFTIVTREIKTNSEFYEWFKNNSKITIIITTLATVDIKMLDTISSNFGGFNSFNAKFSEEAEKIILYGSFISFIIEDLTQLIIQVSV
jgi:uncharacterized lipoprotein YehR (DUF1307 family)